MEHSLLLTQCIRFCVNRIIALVNEWSLSVMCVLYHHALQHMLCWDGGGPLAGTHTHTQASMNTSQGYARQYHQLILPCVYTMSSYSNVRVKEV